MKERIKASISRVPHATSLVFTTSWFALALELQKRPISKG